MTDPVSEDYWGAVLERLLKTLGQAAVAAATVALVKVTASDAETFWQIDWWSVLGVALLAAVLSLLTSVASTKFGRSRGPSLAGEVLAAEAPQRRPRPGTARPGGPRHAAPDTDPRLDPNAGPGGASR